MSKEVIDISVNRELMEMLGKSLTFTDIETIGTDIFKKYSTHELEKVADTVSISPVNAARRLVLECEEKNKLNQLIGEYNQLLSDYQSSTHPSTAQSVTPLP